jgi:hypothetical protein
MLLVGSVRTDEGTVERTGIAVPESCAEGCGGRFLPLGAWKVVVMIEGYRIVEHWATAPLGVPSIHTASREDLGSAARS